MRWTWLLAAGLLVLTAGCSGRKTDTARELTERQRDSILSRSRLPGAGAVGRALNASDRATSRAANLDAQVDSLPR